MRMPPRRVLLRLFTENAGTPCYLSAEIGHLKIRKAPFGSARIGVDPMVARVKTVLGWIVGPLCALVIVPAVFFIERSLRFEKRRDPAWRSR
jgi:hypothetical protein